MDIVGASDNAEDTPTSEATSDEEVQDESLNAKVNEILTILGRNTSISQESIQRYLLGADGNVNIALNHMLASLTDFQLSNPALEDVGIENGATPMSKSEQQKNSNEPAHQTLLRQLAEEVKCLLCLEYLNKPMALDCLHTFCARCLEKIVAVESNSQYIKCPLCTTTVTLDERGVMGLKHNHYLANICEKLKTVQNSRTCGECHQKLSTTYCQQCNAFLCGECDLRIHALHLMREHSRIPVEDAILTYPMRRVSSQLVLLDSALPFAVEKEACQSLFVQWASTLWFAPDDLAQVQLASLKPIYLPFWQYNVKSQTSYRLFSWQFGTSPKVGLFEGTYNDIIVYGSNSYDEELIKSLGPWPLEATKQMNYAQTDGVEVQPYTMASEKAWEETGRQQLYLRAKNDTCRKLSLRRPEEKMIFVEVHSQQEPVRLFLPIYCASYNVKHKNFKVFINGSTGKVVAERPYSLNKVVFPSGVAAAVGGLLLNRLMRSM